MVFQDELNLIYGKPFPQAIGGPSEQRSSGINFRALSFLYWCKWSWLNEAYILHAVCFVQAMISNNLIISDLISPLHPILLPVMFVLTLSNYMLIIFSINCFVYKLSSEDDENASHQRKTWRYSDDSERHYILSWEAVTMWLKQFLL